MFGYQLKYPINIILNVLNFYYIDAVFSHVFYYTSIFIIRNIPTRCSYGKISNVSYFTDFLIHSYKIAYTIGEYNE